MESRGWVWGKVGLKDTPNRAAVKLLMSPCNGRVLSTGVGKCSCLLMNFQETFSLLIVNFRYNSLRVPAAHFISSMNIISIVWLAVVDIFLPG